MRIKTSLSPPTVFLEAQQQMQLFWKEGTISSKGSSIKLFETELANLFLPDHRYVIALNSGTSALHLGLKNIGIKYGDIILCQSLTYVACINAILYQGATPVLIDSERDTWNLDPEQLIKAIEYYASIGNKPKAILGVHIYGMPFKINEIRNICDTYEIPLIEDAAEALGSDFMGLPLGGFGDQGVFSFNRNKIVSTLGGGVLISKSRKFQDRARFWAHQSNSISKSNSTSKGYHHHEIGYNYGISSIQAALGNSMLPFLKQLVDDRIRIFNTYKNHLNDYIDWQPEALGVRSNRWLSAGLCKSNILRNQIMENLRKHDIESRTIWRPMHLQPLCASFKVFETGVSEDLWKRGICLPSGYGLDPNPIIKIIKSTYED